MAFSIPFDARNRDKTYCNCCSIYLNDIIQPKKILTIRSAMNPSGDEPDLILTALFDETLSYYLSLCLSLFYLLTLATALSCSTLSNSNYTIYMRDSTDRQTIIASTFNLISFYAT